MLMFVPTVELPEQVLLRLPTTQELAAPGKSGACVAAIADVTEMPFTVNGAELAHDQVVGQVTEPGSEHEPVSCTDTLVIGTDAFQVIRILGLTGTAAK